jgi:hypothetical protein
MDEYEHEAERGLGRGDEAINDLEPEPEEGEAVKGGNAGDPTSSGRPRL